MAVQQNKTTTTAADKQATLVLVGRKSQYVTGLGIMRRGIKFTVSETHAKKMLKATNRATGDRLFMRQKDFEESKAESDGDNNLDLGLGTNAAPKSAAKDEVTIEEA